MMKKRVRATLGGQEVDGEVRQRGTLVELKLDADLPGLTAGHWYAPAEGRGAVLRGGGDLAQRWMFAYHGHGGGRPRAGRPRVAEDRVGQMVYLERSTREAFRDLCRGKGGASKVLRKFIEQYVVDADGTETGKAS